MTWVFSQKRMILRHTTKLLAFINGATRNIHSDISAYKWFLPTQTRWKDNDMYNHVNNAVYHAIFDTTINVYLIQHGKMRSQTAVGYMVHTECHYKSPISYPILYLTGMRVEKIGNSSVTYECAIFEPLNIHQSIFTDCVLGHFSDDSGALVQKFKNTACGLGRYTHVFVDPTKDGKPIRIPDSIRESLGRIQT